MGLWSAAPFLVTASLKNRARAQLRRLKSPRYLIGAAVGLFYIWTIFLRRLVMPPRGFGAPEEALAPELLFLIEMMMVLGGVMVVTSAWLFGSNSRSALRYSEAEIQFFFAGPVSRRQILHYKLVRTLVQTLVSALITTLLFGRNLAGNAAFFVVGSFFTLGAIALHVTGASLTRETLGKHGRYGIAQRALTLLVIVGVLGGMAWWVYGSSRPEAPDVPDKDAWLAYLHALTDSGPMRVLLWPFRAPLKVALAQDTRQFLLALPGGLVVLLANYLWVISSDHAFEESAVQNSERWAQRVEAWKAGRQQARYEAKPFRLKLAPTGRPEVALAWKALASFRRLLRFGLLPLLLSVMFLAGMMVFVFTRQQQGLVTMGGAFLFALVGLFTAVGGPTALPIDLRRDLQHLELLKAWPLSGTQIVIGELLGPFALLTLVQWLCWLLAFALSLFADGAAFPLILRGSVAVGAMIVGPALTAITLVLLNGAVLLFPAWVSHEPRRGVEAMGQRILALAGGLLVLAVGVLPATLVGGGVLFVFGAALGMGPLAIPLAALAAAAVLCLEVSFAVAGMGGLVERLDPSEQTAS